MSEEEKVIPKKESTERVTDLSSPIIANDISGGIWNEFYKTPMTSPGNTINKAIANAGRKDLFSGKSTGHVKVKTEIRNDGREYHMIQYGGNSTSYAIITDVPALEKARAPVKKIFTLALTKIPQQAVFNGEMVSSKIQFSLKELVDNGAYKNIETAKKAVISAQDGLQAIKAKATITKKWPDREEVTGKITAVLFPTIAVKNSICTISLNTDLNWGPFLDYFMIFPKWAYSLSARAFDMLWRILYHGRMNAKKLPNGDYSFTITNKAIQVALGLMPEEGNTDTKRTIKEKIDNAISEIEEVQAARGNKNAWIMITPKYTAEDRRVNITDYLAAPVEIVLRGRYAEYIDDLREKKKENIKKQEKKAEQQVAKRKKQ